MSDSERDVKKAAELKLWREGRVNELEEELEPLRETLGYVDDTLRATTFKPAIEMMSEARDAPEMRDLKRDKGGQVVARAAVTHDSVSIEPAEGVSLKSTTPPFRSFLLSKILTGMKTKDQELMSAGKISDGTGLTFDVEENNGSIQRLTIENYREKSRLTEILNTVAWTFSRMLEK